MSVMTSFTRRSLAKNRVRTVVAVLGITLSVALICAILTCVSSLQAALEQRTVNTEGSWHAYFTLPAEKAEGELDALAASDDATDIASSLELGVAPFSEADGTYYGSMVVLRTLPETIKGTAHYDAAAATASPSDDEASAAAEEPYLTMMPELVEGRMPAATGEITLPSTLRGAELGADGTGNVQTDGALGVGSTLTLDAGRYATAGTSLDAMTAQAIFDQAEYDEENEITTDDGETPAAALPELVDVQTRTYTVVGFYESGPSFLGSGFTAGASGGACALVVPEEAANYPAAGQFDNVWVVTQNLGSTDAIESLVTDACPSAASLTVHTNLLRFLGIHADGALIWSSLYIYAAVLLVVIAVASVSLIYNAFAISVAERTRQFGLLASIGASKRQLRRAVLTEALFLGAVALPCGILLGIGGTAVVLELTRGAFASALNTAGGIPLTVAPASIAASIAIALVVLLASAWIPAWRAARVSAVDAIRQTQDVKLSRRAQRKLRRMQAAAKQGAHAPLANGTSENAISAALRTHGIAERLFGASGTLAHRNLSRASGRGRVVVASLAVSVALVVVTGSIALYLDPLVDRANTKALGGTDVAVSAFARYSDGVEERPFAETFAEVKGIVANTGGAQITGTILQGQAEASVPASMTGENARAAQLAINEMSSASWVPDAFSADGTYTGAVTIFYVDDATWTGMIDDLGLDVDAFNDPEHPRAIGIGSYQAYNPSTGQYVDADALTAGGTLDLYATEEIEGYARMGLMRTDDGELVAGYVPNTGIEDESEIVTYPLDEIAVHRTVDVAAVTDDMPAALVSISATNHFPAIVLPEAVAEHAQGTDTADVFAYSFGMIDIAADDHAAVAETLESTLSGVRGGSAMVTDVAAQAESSRMIYDALKLFILCFTVITMLVAVANVFNTLANSIILRTREFAVLRSVGMGNRAFARMLAYECASYAVRGLVIGLAIAAVASWFLYWGTSLSFAGTSFTLPWGYVGIACLLVLAVLAASVAYALRRSHAMNIVEALRAEAL